MFVLIAATVAAVRHNTTMRLTTSTADTAFTSAAVAIAIAIAIAIAAGAAAVIISVTIDVVVS